MWLFRMWHVCLQQFSPTKRKIYETNFYHCYFKLLYCCLHTNSKDAFWVKTVNNHAKFELGLDWACVYNVLCYFSLEVTQQNENEQETPYYSASLLVRLRMSEYM